MGAAAGVAGSAEAGVALGAAVALGPSLAPGAAAAVAAGAGAVALGRSAQLGPGTFAGGIVRWRCKTAGVSGPRSVGAFDHFGASQ